MRKYFPFFLFLFAANMIFAQQNFRIMSLGISSLTQKEVGGNSIFPDKTNTFHKTIFYYTYNSLHEIPKTPFYFAMGTRFQNIYPLVTARMGVATNLYTEKNPVYLVMGSEISSNKGGFYSQLHFALNKKKYAFLLSPELIYSFHDVFAVRNIYNNNATKVVDRFTVGGSIGIGWDKRSVVPKKQRKYRKINHFSLEMSKGTINYYFVKAFLKDYRNVSHLTLSYRVFAKQIISPEIGLGFIEKYNPVNFVQVAFGHHINQYFYEESQDYLPYLKLGMDIQTRGKVGLLAKGYVFEGVAGDSQGYCGQIGIKFAVSPKLALSISHEWLTYAGKIRGWYRKFGEYDSNYPQAISPDIKTNDLHKSVQGFYSLRLGIHFL